ncbi:MAG: hypothetical protein ACM37Z_21900 [Deltaproteobacteria bacterium]|jgi:hypothetical protein
MNYQNHTVAREILTRRMTPSWKYHVGAWLLELVEFIVAAWILLAAGHWIFGLASRFIP